MKAKNILLACLAVTMLLPLLPTDLSAQGAKIGFVRDDEIITNYKAWQRAQEQFDVERKAWDEEATTKQQELQDLLDEYERQALILSEEKKAEREAIIRTKKEALDAFTRQIYGPGGTAEKKHEQLLMPLQENVTRAIEAVALEDGYDVIFTMQSGLGYIKETLDVTDKVLKALAELE